MRLTKTDLVIVLINYNNTDGNGTTTLFNIPSFARLASKGGGTMMGARGAHEQGRYKGQGYHAVDKALEVSIFPIESL